MAYLHNDIFLTDIIGMTGCHLVNRESDPFTVSWIAMGSCIWVLHLGGCN